MSDEIKAGARHSGKDKAALQLAHDALVQAGAECVVEDETMPEEKNVEIPEDMYINFGGAVKSLNGINEQTTPLCITAKI